MGGEVQKAAEVMWDGLPWPSGSGLDTFSRGRTAWEGRPSLAIHIDQPSLSPAARNLKLFPLSILLMDFGPIGFGGPFSL
jgi:hypothetical protein